ncbi:hypothetical protein EJV47_04620 [Hymenobacter gummosus]|uniref:Uncharacterized protein n=1 Tax=Hymenobacter gummosus TaxID=1776032 RepID=A0A3S0K7P1_9BACT|nr:hypothetical protein [Hymenobacter gummosus]RTQ52311.1 hypothetical protein EJV47_04620 [Hymenobacter gummosus]
MSQISADQVARWMLDQLQAEGVLYQVTAIDGIEARFGAAYTCLNANGNIGIAPAVLKAFRQLTAASVVWERSGRFWRWREAHDPSGRQLA